MKRHQAESPVRAMCRVLGLSPSGYYAWLQRPPSAREVANARLVAEMRRIHTFSRRSYGRPRMYAELRDEGFLVNHKRVGRLMRQAGIVGVTRIEAGRLTIAPAPVALSTLLDHLEEAHAPAAGTAGLRWEVERPDEPITLPIDEGRLLQALGNLVGNAFKFTPEGGAVRILVDQTPQGVIIGEAHGGRLRLESE